MADISALQGSLDAPAFQLHSSTRVPTQRQSRARLGEFVPSDRTPVANMPPI